MNRLGDMADESNPHQQHPLLIDVVLENLFEYLDFENLDKCRRVCRLWKDVSEPFWCRQSPVQTIQQNLDLDNTIDLIGKAKKGSYNDDDDEWAANRYNKFRLTQFTFGKNFMTDYKIWETHGNLITQLEIAYCRFEVAVAAFPDVLFCRATPALETLKLKGVIFPLALALEHAKQHVNPVNSMRVLEIEYNDYSRVLPVPWESVLECFTRLQSLILKNFDPGKGPYSELTRLMVGFNNFHQKHGQAHHLTRLNFFEGLPRWGFRRAPRQFPNSVLEVLLQQDNTHALLLGSLGFCAALPTDTDNIYELLLHQGQTLRRLEIRCNRLVPGFVIAAEDLKLPLMQHLTRLDLTEYRPRSFKFLYGCPNLKHLNVIIHHRLLNETDTVLCNPIREYIHEPRHLLLQSMQSFHCNLTTDWNEEDMLVLGKSLPNLRSLLLFVNESSFRGICQAFPQLRRLFLREFKLTNASFTGFTSTGRGVFGGNNSAPFVVSYPRMPNITNFKHLQVLGIQCCCNGFGRPISTTTGLMLTSNLVTHGLLQIPSLNKIYISNFGMTMPGFEALQQTGLQVAHSSDLIPIAMNPF